MISRWIALGMTLLPAFLASHARGEAAKYDIVELPAPADMSTYAAAVNSRGDVAGRTTNSAVLWRDGKMADLGTFGQEASVAEALNDKGQVIGEAYSLPTCHKPSYAVIWENGTAKDIGHLDPGRPHARARGINNKGQVVGWSPTGNGDRAFIWDSEKGMRDLGYLSYKVSMAYAINDNGQVVGESAYQAFLWQDGKMTRLPMLEGTSVSSATAINDKGQVVGSCSTVGKTWSDCVGRACLWENGKVVALAGSGGNSGASGINNKGQIVGVSGGVPVIWEDGKMTELNTLIPADSGWTLLYVSDINDKGQIVGSGKLKGQNRAFLLTPKP